MEFGEKRIFLVFGLQLENEKRYRTGNIGIIDRQKHIYSHSHAILQLLFRVLVLVFRNCKTSAAYLAKMMMLRMVMTMIMVMMVTNMIMMMMAMIMMIMIFQDRAKLGCEP